MEYAFTLIVSGMDVLDDGVCNALYEAGCDDGTIASRDGVVSITFTREAPSYEQAVASAIRDVQKVRGLRVVRVERGHPTPRR